MIVLRLTTAQIKTLMQCWSVPISQKMKQRFHMAFKMMGRIVCECWQCKWKGMNEDGVSMSCLEGSTKKPTLCNNVKERNLWNYGRRDCVCGMFCLCLCSYHMNCMWSKKMNNMWMNSCSEAIVMWSEKMNKMWMSSCSEAILSNH